MNNAHKIINNKMYGLASIPNSVSRKSAIRRIKEKNMGRNKITF